jgi:hypothetical protein
MEKGLRGVAQRLASAEENFIATLMERGSITRPEAERVLALYRKMKLVRRDAVSGVINVKHGGFLDRDVIQRALHKAP